jgi:hypothetical protein
MRLLRLGTLGVLLGCSTTPGITLSATPNPLTGDGETTATVTATVTGGSDVVVHFKTNLGTFTQAQAGTPTLADVTEGGDRKAVATLTAPRQGWGTITLTASASMGGKEPSASVTLPLQPSGGLAASLSFTCQHQNVGAFVTGRLTTIHLLCTATALDAQNHVIPKASVQTLAEAGTLTWLKDDQGVQQFVYSVRPDDHPPKDVDPLDASGNPQGVCPASCNNVFGPGCQGEPCWTDATGITHNPRDGVVTLIAAVPGVKSFDNQGEPYVDKNDNGTRDADEEFIDYNGNGKWDGPDGQLKDRVIWKEFRIIWSGEASIPPAGGGTHQSYMTKSAGNVVTANFVDKNLNALAADGASASDGIDWSATCTGGSALDVPSTVMDQVNPGILFTADTGAISAKQNRTTYTRNINYGDHLSFPAGVTKDSCTITAAPRRAYDPGAPGYPAEGVDPDAALVYNFSFP